LLKKITVRAFFCLAGFFLAPTYGLPDTVPPGSSPLITTGQSSCYDNSGTIIPCKGTGQDGEFQKGTTRPDPRFTEHGNGTVTDKVTALMWTKDAQQIKGTRQWSNALNSCNHFDFAGYTDWRLPHVRELLSLIDYGEHDPALPKGHPFTTLEVMFYWSSTTYDASTINAWGVYLYNGYVYNYHKITEGYVWPVRGGR
jgi:Protein of unknown function (DUF1566)